jgi:hypothetical protein
MEGMRFGFFPSLVPRRPLSPCNPARTLSYPTPSLARPSMPRRVCCYDLTTDQRHRTPSLPIPPHPIPHPHPILSKVGGQAEASLRAHMTQAIKVRTSPVDTHARTQHAKAGLVPPLVMSPLRLRLRLGTPLHADQSPVSCQTRFDYYSRAHVSFCAMTSRHGSLAFHSQLPTTPCCGYTCVEPLLFIYTTLPTPSSPSLPSTHLVVHITPQPEPHSS